MLVPIAVFGQRDTENFRKIRLSIKELKVIEGYPWNIDSMKVNNNDSVHFEILCYKDSIDLDLLRVSKRFDDKSYTSTIFDSTCRPVSLVVFMPTDEKKYEYNWVWGNDGSLKSISEFYDKKLVRVIKLPKKRKPKTR